MSVQMTGVRIPAWTLGEEFSITLFPYGEVTTSINYTCGTASGVVATDVPYSTGSVKCTLPRSLASQNTSGEFVTVTFEVITCVDGVETGSYTVNQSFEIPVDVCPYCSISVSDTTDGYSTFGGYLTGYSQIKIDVNPVLAYESEIVDCVIEAGGWTMHGGSATWAFFDTAVKIKAVVTDARGRSYTAEKNITLIDYEYPTISLLTAVRCDANGNEDKQGSNIKVTYSGTVDPVNNKNSYPTCILKYKKSTATSYTSVPLSHSTYTVSNATYIFAADTATGYDIVLQLDDLVDSVERTTTAPSGFVLMDFKADGTAMAIGKAAETSNMFDVGLAANFDKGITANGDVLLGRGWTEGNIASAYLRLTEKYWANLAATGGLSISSPQFQLTSDMANFGVPLYENWRKVLLAGDVYSKTQVDAFIKDIDWFSVGTQIPSGSDLDTYTALGKYSANTTSIAASLLNCPTGENFSMFVFERTDGTIQQMIVTHNSNFYLRGQTSSGLKPWTQLVGVTGNDSVFHYHPYKTTVGAMAFGTTGNIAFYDSETKAISETDMRGYIGFGGGTNLNVSSRKYIYVMPYEEDSGSGYCFGGSSVRPNTDSVRDLGTSSLKWNNVYAAKGTIQTSDRNLKTDIIELDQKYVDFFDDLVPVSYKLTLPGSDRTHVGFISQDVKEAMDKAGLSDMDFAGYCKDQKTVFNKDTEEFEPVVDEDGNPEFIHSLRYEEFIALNTKMIQTARMKIAEQAEEIKTLRSELDAIKTALGMVSE